MSAHITVAYYPDTEEEVVEDATFSDATVASLWLATRVIGWCIDEDVRITINGQVVGQVATTSGSAHE